MSDTIVQRGGETPPLAAALDATDDKATFEAIAAYVDEHFAGHVTTADLARAGAVSRTRMFELFRTYAHTTPADYLIEHRVMRAEALLAETDLPMADIARRCGFSSPSHFSKVYRQRTGQTPTAARERLRLRARHRSAGPLEGIAPALTMQLVGMSYLPAEAGGTGARST